MIRIEQHKVKWKRIRYSFLGIILVLYILSLVKGPVFHWWFWWAWFSSVLLALPLLMGKIGCGWLCMYGAIHDLILERLKYPRLKLPKKVESFWVLYAILGILATVEIFYDWDFYYWYVLFFLIFPVLFGLLFAPRTWCRYLCPLGAYGNLYSRVRFFGIKVEKDKCKNCPVCICERECPMHIQWKEEIIGKESWITPDYCMQCFNCVERCPYKAVSFGRVQ